MEASRALAIRLLGGFHVAIDEQDVPETVWRQKRAAAVVKLLALDPAHRVHREQLIDALWPELDPAAGANNLRVALHHARQGLLMAGAAAGAFLTRDGDVVSLGADELVRVDVDDFDAALRRAWRSPEPRVSQAALDLYGGDLLPDDLYEDWADGRRTALRASYFTLLRRLAQLHEQRAELDQAIVTLQRLIAADPDDEDAHAALMRLFAHTGRQHLALEQYDRLVSHLDQGLGTEPRPATRELIAAIREDRLPDQVSPLVAGAPPAVPRPHGLPAPVDELIGRERERAELRHLVATTRLITLTGPGGVGKTRLALAVAHDAAAGFADGAYLAELASIEDPELVLPTIARALGTHEAAGQPLIETLTEHLAQQQALLVVDNMEHVAAAAPVVTSLLSACPGLKALITSRARLTLRGEQEYPVQPLALPDVLTDGQRGTVLPATILADVPAVALFTRRARAARPDFALSGSNAAAVAEICRRLDGLPLAIELAAARVRLLPPAELLTRLAQPLAVLTGGPHDAPDRHRSLRATIAWSHDLLTPEEQNVFALLSVFAGGFTTEAAELLAGGGRAGRWSPVSPEASLARRPASSAPAARVLALVASLVDHSLLRLAVAPYGDARLSMLETIREYARERLEFHGEADDARRRHAALFLSLAAQAEPELSGPDQAAWLDRLETEHDNLRQALTTLHESGEGHDLLRLAAALWRFWWQRGFLSEGRRWLELAVAAGDEGEGEPAVRAAAHDGAGALAEAQGDFAAAAVHHQAALALRREIGDRRGEARSLADFGIIADKMGEPERAKQLFAEALAIAREEKDQPRVAACLANLGFVLLDQGELDRAAVTFRESLERFRDLGDQRNLSYVLGGLGTLAFLQGDYGGAAAIQEEALRVLRTLGDPQGIADTVADLGHSVQRQGDIGRAQELYVEALHRYRELGDPSGAAFVLTHLGRLARELGDLPRATAYLRESFQVSQQIGEKPQLTEAVEGLAEVACAGGEPALCARLLGAAEALREETGIPLPALHEPAMAWCVATARAALGDAGFAAARGEGRALAPEQTLAPLAIDGAT